MLTLEKFNNKNPKTINDNTQLLVDECGRYCSEPFTCTISFIFKNHPIFK